MTLEQPMEGNKHVDIKELKERQDYIQPLLDFVNKLPLSKQNKIKFIEDMLAHRETAFVKQEVKEVKKEEMPMFYNAETGEKMYSTAGTLFLSVGDALDKKE